MQIMRMGGLSLIRLTLINFTMPKGNVEKLLEFTFVLTFTMLFTVVGEKTFPYCYHYLLLLM